MEKRLTLTELMRQLGQSKSKKKIKAVTKNLVIARRAKRRKK